MSGASIKKVIKKLLLVEDDKELSELTKTYLQKHGFEVSIEADGSKASYRIINQQPELVILDIMLPGKDGFAICKEVRPAYNKPILILTARDEDIDQLLGLELGADDYICKPVHPRLLLARIHALLRRSTQSTSITNDALLSFGDLCINAKKYEVTINKLPLFLTTAEFKLLYLLAQNSGSILSRDKILYHLRGIHYDGADRSIDLRISRLRKKLGDSAQIKTIRGSGYLFIAKSQ